ncbi:protein of unknown function [Burkholderia multivorans]
MPVPRQRLRRRRREAQPRRAARAAWREARAESLMRHDTTCMTPARVCPASIVARRAHGGH